MSEKFVNTRQFQSTRVIMFRTWSAGSTWLPFRGPSATNNKVWGLAAAIRRAALQVWPVDLQESNGSGQNEVIDFT